MSIVDKLKEKVEEIQKTQPGENEAREATDKIISGGESIANQIGSAFPQPAPPQRRLLTAADRRRLKKQYRRGKLKRGFARFGKVITGLGKTFGGLIPGVGGVVKGAAGGLHGLALKNEAKGQKMMDDADRILRQGYFD